MTLTKSGNTLNEDEQATIPFDASECANAFHNMFAKLYNSSLFSDIKVQVGPNAFLHAHRVVLSAWSSQLKRRVDNSTNNVVVLNEAAEDQHLFEAIVQYLYKGNCDLQSKDLVKVVQITFALGISLLKEDCAVQIFRNSTTHDVGYCLDLAHKYECSRLEAECASFLAKEFDDLLKQEVLFTLPVSTWKQLLHNDEIKARSEQDICESVFKLVHLIAKDQEHKVAILNELLPEIRIPFLSGKYIISHIEPWEYQVPVLHNLLYEAFKYKACPKRSRLNLSPRRGLLFQWSTERKSTGIKVKDTNVLTHVGGQSTWQSITAAEYYTTGVHTWSFKIISNVSNWMFIGIATKDWSGWTDQSSGYVGYSPMSWSCGSYQGWGRTHGGQNAPGLTYTNGDVLSIRVDLDQGTLSFAVNGKSDGVAYNGIKGPITPAVTLYQNGDSVGIAEEMIDIEETATNKSTTASTTRRGRRVARK
eukprot:CAMPEP_0168576342 /NCGR_PEP_ID=MMETSP0413-20121227/20187_1 /TAXON_ID=136452 /ORGANISM="Filamoeba nolandi, Strain NC-AS-23-1" /LENGTH=474 /DNA_ID=CAMNT_0008609993 /DNA_START=79 /DNA_END=1503 /DNA_ORIENTATION=-